MMILSSSSSSSSTLLTTSKSNPLAAGATTTTAPRPAVILPGLGNNTGDYKALATILNDSYGIPTVVAKVSRLDWLRNAAGLLDVNYWRGTLRPRPVLDWYLQRAEEAVTEAKQQGGSVSLIGHSAGGWLARVYMEEFGRDSISLLLTLGCPHLERDFYRPPPKGLPGVIDQTRGLLDYVSKNCAPAVYSPELKYVCISGRYIQGARMVGNSNMVSDGILTADKEEAFAESPANDNIGKPTSANPTIRARFIGQGYKQVCGQAEVWGDGVVPEISAHLEGALNESLDGVYHSPVGSENVSSPWYGSPAVVEKWAHHLLGGGF